MTDAEATDTDALFRATLKVFGERDRSARLAAIAEVYTDDILFTDPDGSVIGHAALDAKVQGLLDGAPADFVLADDGPLYVSGDTGALAWTFGPEGAPAVRGIDIMTITGGRVSALLTLLADS